MKSNNEYDVFRGVGVEVIFDDPQNFLKIKETLTRIGIPNKEKNTLCQSCHILHKRDREGKSRYSIVHFKEMFKLDGKQTNFDDDDRLRRNLIVDLLCEWELLSVPEHDEFKMEDIGTLNLVTIVPFKDKKSWNLISKYSIGVKDGNK